MEKNPIKTNIKNEICLKDNKYKSKMSSTVKKTMKAKANAMAAELSATYKKTNKIAKLVYSAGSQICTGENGEQTVTVKDVAEMQRAFQEALKKAMMDLVTRPKPEGKPKKARVVIVSDQLADYLMDLAVTCGISDPKKIFVDPENNAIDVSLNPSRLYNAANRLQHTGAKSLHADAKGSHQSNLQVITPDSAFMKYFGKGDCRFKVNGKVVTANDLDKGYEQLDVYLADRAVYTNNDIPLDRTKSLLSNFESQGFACKMDVKMAHDGREVRGAMTTKFGTIQKLVAAYSLPSGALGLEYSSESAQSSVDLVAERFDAIKDSSS